MYRVVFHFPYASVTLNLTRQELARAKDLMKGDLPFAIKHNAPVLGKDNFTEYLINPKMVTYVQINDEES